MFSMAEIEEYHIYMYSYIMILEQYNVGIGALSFGSVKNPHRIEKYLCLGICLS